MAKTPEENLKVSERLLQVRQRIRALEEKEVELTEKEQQELLKLETTLAKILKFQEKRIKAALGTYQAELDVKKAISGQAKDLGSISSVYDGLVSKQRESLKATQNIADSVKDTMLKEDAKKQVLDSTLTGVTQLQNLQQQLAQTGPDEIEKQQAIRDEYIAKKNEILEEISRKKDSLGLTEQEAIALESMVHTQETSYNIAEQFATVQSKTKDFIQKQLDVYEGIEKTIRGTLNTVKVLASTTGGKLGGAFIGISMVGKDILKTQRELGGDLLSTQNIATNLFSKVFPNAAETTKSLSKEFGGLNDVSLQTQFRTNVLSKNLGISAGEAASLTGSFSRLNDGSASTAQDLIVSTKELAKQNGLVPADLMADVANSTEAFALFGKDGGKNIAEAAVAAGKLGVSMSQITGVADNLLDFESSITKELELGAMLGRNINLDRARALAYEGDIGGAVRETLSSLGGIEEFNKMDYFQKKATADLLGVSVAEFQKMADNADKLGKNGEIQVTQYQAMKESLMGMGESALSLLSSLGSASIALGQMGGSLKGMKGVFGSIKGGFQKLFKTDALSKARKNLSDKQIAAGFGGKKAKDMLAAKTTAKLPQTSVTEKLNQTSGGGSKGINVKNMMKGAAAILILSAALFVAAKAFQEFGSVTWPQVGMGLASLVLLAGIATLLGKAEKQMIKGATALAILGVALIPFAFAMNLISGLNIGAVLAAAAGLVVFTAAIFGLGALMTSGVGAVIFGAGILALIALGSSMIVLGAGLLVAAAGFKALGGSMGNIASIMVQVKDTLGGLFQYIAPIAALSLALVGLAGALTMVGLAGVAALPGLMAVAAVGAVAIGVGSLFGIGDSGEKEKSPQWAVDLEKAIRETKDVYMDSTKVTAMVIKTGRELGMNTYSI